MIIIIGLGNPGRKFFGTRHNLGFAFLNYLKNLGDFDEWQSKDLFRAKIAKGKLFGKAVILAKPQTFMNNSGEAVLKLFKFYKVLPENIWVVHDDIDLDLGKIKIVKGKGSAGHKGVESIIKSLGTKDFVRFRIGIKPLKISERQVVNSKRQTVNSKKLEKFVLQKFSKEEKKILANTKKNFGLAIETALKENFQKAMTEFNKNKGSA